MSAYLTPNEAAAIADVHPSTIRDWCARHPELGRKIGIGAKAPIRIDPDVLAEILKGQPVIRHTV